MKHYQLSKNSIDIMYYMHIIFCDIFYITSMILENKCDAAAVSHRHVLVCFDRRSQHSGPMRTTARSAAAAARVMKISRAHNNLILFCLLFGRLARSRPCGPGTRLPYLTKHRPETSSRRNRVDYSNPFYPPNVTFFSASPRRSSNSFFFFFLIHSSLFTVSVRK